MGSLLVNTTGRSITDYMQENAMASSGEIVRAACNVIWTQGEVDRVSEFYSEDFRADYPMTDWGTGPAGVAALAGFVRKDIPDYA